MTELQEQQLLWVIISNSIYASAWCICFIISCLFLFSGYLYMKKEEALKNMRLKVISEIPTTDKISNIKIDDGPSITMRLTLAPVVCIMSSIAMIVFGSNVVQAIYTPLIVIKNCRW